MTWEAQSLSECSTLGHCVRRLGTSSSFTFPAVHAKVFDPGIISDHHDGRALQLPLTRDTEHFTKDIGLSALSPQASRSLKQIELCSAPCREVQGAWPFPFSFPMPPPSAALSLQRTGALLRAAGEPS